MTQLRQIPESSPNSTVEVTAGVVSFGLFVKALWVGRRIVGVVIGVCVILAVLYGTSLNPTYTATALIGPIQSENGSAPGGTLQALSAMSGGSFGSQQGGYEKYMALLQSMRLAQDLEANHHISRLLYDTLWDSTTHQWKRPHGPLASVKTSVKRMLGYPEWKPPSAENVASTLQTELGVHTNTAASGGISLAVLKSQLSVISFNYKTPQGATELLDLILRSADALARKDRIENLSRRISYLKQAIQGTTDLTLRDSLEKILSDQERMLMTVKSDRFYAIDMIDPPNASTAIPSAGYSRLITFGVLFGLIISALIIFLILRARLLADPERPCNPFETPFPDPIVAVSDLAKRIKFY
jgi:hypothetical protein